ncbi:hypothetical protein CIW53_09105 [Rhodanobacter sp. T12-5]|nr:hypothetical protein CIW53_09105 [Rhodanobacter sp. T12-5]
MFRGCAGSTGRRDRRLTGRSLRLALGDQLGQSRLMLVGVTPPFFARMLDGQVCDQGTHADHPEPDPDLLGRHCD